MLGFHAIADAAICDLADELTAAALNSASAVVSCTLGVVTVAISTAILTDPSEDPVFAIEIYPRPLAMN